MVTMKICQCCHVYANEAHKEWCVTLAPNAQAKKNMEEFETTNIAVCVYAKAIGNNPKVRLVLIDNVHATVKAKLKDGQLCKYSFEQVCDVYEKSARKHTVTK